MWATWLVKLGGSQEVCRGSESVRWWAPFGAVARRTRPSSLASLRGRATREPADSPSTYRATRRSLLRLSRAAGREPQSGFPDGAGEEGERRFLVQLFGLDVPLTTQRQVPVVPLRLRAPDPVHRKSGGLSCCAAASCTHSANCAADRRNSPGAVLGAGS